MTFSGTSRRRALKLGLAASLAAPAFARAQAWPNGPIVFLNPFPAGGGTDTFCRPLAAQLGDQLGQPIIVDNKGGAGGTKRIRAEIEKWQKVVAAADVRID